MQTMIEHYQVCCRYTENVKLNKDKWHLRCIICPYLETLFPGMLWNQIEKRYRHWQKCYHPSQRITGIYRYHELPSQVYNSWSMWATVQNDIHKDRQDLEYNIPDLYERGKVLIMKDACVKFCDEKKLVYIETDTSGLCFGAGLLWTALEMRHWTTQFYDLQCLPAIVCQAVRDSTAIPEGKQYEYYMGYKKSTITAL